ncbi:ABC transporter permease [Pectinatus brassicae]|uniref:Putative ABC transport system permease protein n=1 Tax=Pectinatus brassicae TaxID=862415 RepID=A0A840UQK3_9FIRM|nr:iron export ABC transporter permease subunit FetB [Pectinatus brassicae]MBB5335114.1 putative ABC transport system permease protein [Pectinatus brassicae]
MNNTALILTYILPAIALFISYREKLCLEKDIIIGSIRAVIQLVLIGLALKFIFGINNAYLTSLILLIMIYNACIVAAQRGQGIAHVKAISFTAIFLSLFLTLGSLVLFNAINYTPSQVIPISGMVVGNSMVALGILYRNLISNFADRHDEIEVKLCLGASPHQAAQSLIRNSIKTAMVPTIDSMKTLGIVQLPGMMTGLILAGVAPETAIKYQIMVAFMLTGAITISSFTASYWAYRGFFTNKAQLISK